MKAKEKLLFLWLFVVVIIAFVVTHFSHHLLFLLENCLACALAGPLRWS
jgi:hypothetical protein